MLKVYTDFILAWMYFIWTEPRDLVGDKLIA